MATVTRGAVGTGCNAAHPVPTAGPNVATSTDCATARLSTSSRQQEVVLAEPVDTCGGGSAQQGEGLAVLLRDACQDDFAEVAQQGVELLDGRAVGGERIEKFLGAGGGLPERRRVMALTETAQSCSPKLLTLSGRQSSGQPSGIVITSSSAGVSAASNRSGIATGSSQCGQSPPTPTRRQGRTHSTHHYSPR